MAGAELLIGGMFVSAIIPRIVDKIQNHIEVHYKLQMSTQKLIKSLSFTLSTIQTTVEQAEKRTIHSTGLSGCLRMLKEAAYEAEDVLDNLVAKSVENEVKRKKVTELAISYLKQLFVSDEDHEKLQDLVKRLKELSTQIQSIISLVDMNQDVRSNFQTDHGREETTSLPSIETGFYGREREQSLILDMILDPKGRESSKNAILDATGPESSKKDILDSKGPESSSKAKLDVTGQDSGKKAVSDTKEQESDKKAEQISVKIYSDLIVIPIVGIGGIGKTALAQAVCNHPEVQHTFKTIWVYIRENCTVREVMLKIIQCIDPFRNPNLHNLEVLSRMLRSCISYMRFLIVLDNVFQIENIWENLHNTLSYGWPHSVVLITTQNQEFANRVGTVGPIVLNSLEPGTFWELFKHVSFKNLLMPEAKKIVLEDIGKQIAEKLHGLPLAAKIIGNILRSKNNEEEWRRICKSEWWDFPNVRRQIIPSIGLGYEHLDPCKRQCFAYCSLFPRNSLLEKERLVQMWMAQNFIPYNISDGVRPEDVGRQWFDELVEKFFFQPAWNNNSYVMPNLMHDLAVIVSSEECFYLNDELPVQIPRSVRHIAVDTKNVQRVREIQICKHLRSFLFFGFCVKGMYETINETLSNLESLRVLDLSYLKMEKTPPPAIQSYTHLRFLDLSYTGIIALTHNNSFNHYHLQALHIQKCELHKWPTEINTLINLRHLNVDADTIAKISGLGQLTSLQELNKYRVGTEKGHKITELKNLREITGSLSIQNCENIKSKGEAMEANLREKDHLDSIVLSWGYRESEIPIPSNIDMETLEGLKPGDNIKELSITDYPGSSFPDLWMQNCHFPNLRNLNLSCCKKIKSLPPLEKFSPSLSSLSIEENYSLKDVPLGCLRASLRTLKILGTPLKSLESYPNSTTCLTSLEITNVEVLISLNIQNLRSLESLILEGSTELSIKGDLQSLTYLKRLKVIGCPQFLMNSMEDIMSKEKGKGLELMHQLGEGLQSLSNLEMDNTLWESRVILGRLPALRILTLRSISGSQFREHETILWFQERTTLRELNFYCCTFEHLPSTMVTLSSLQEMKLGRCENLQSFPEDGMPPNLLKLTLSGYSWLTQQCKPFVGKDWQLISHIPLIHFDNITIIIRKFTSDEGELWKLKSALGEWQIIDEGNVGDIWTLQPPNSSSSSACWNVLTEP